MKLLLLSMPLSPFNPSSQLAVLAGHLDALPGRPHATQTAHLFVHLARRLGLPDWEILSNTAAGTKIGNLLFQRLLFDRGDRSVVQLLGPELARALAVEGIDQGRLERWQAAVDAYWADLLGGQLLALEGHDAYGFSTVFNQLFPSLALARALRQRNPAVRIVFGGVEVHGECGTSVLRRFPFVDAVVVGRGERPLAELLDAWQRGERGEGIGGVAVRRTPSSPAQGAPDEGATALVLAAPPRPADEPPLFGRPDHQEFYRTLTAAGLPPQASTGLPLEASQGCWWRRCDFCGSRDIFPRYALKDAAQIRQEVEQAVGRHDAYHLIFTDEAVPVQRLLEAFAPLAAAPWARHLAWLAQIRATFGKEQLAALARAGLRVAQVGIESFSNAVLARMDKGTTALQNVRCLKWCAEQGIAVDYNLILGYPFAEDDDAERCAALFPLLWHLDPPQPSDFYVHRYSRLFAPGALPPGWRLRPSPLYNADLLPDELDGLAFIAHEPLPPGDGGPRRGDLALAAAMARWQEHHRPGLLHFFHGLETVTVHDGRAGRARTLRLGGLARAVFLACDDVRTTAELTAEFGEQAAAALQVASELEQRRLLLRDGEQWLTLAPLYPGRVAWR